MEKKRMNEAGTAVIVVTQSVNLQATLRGIDEGRTVSFTRKELGSPSETTVRATLSRLNGEGRGSYELLQPVKVVDGDIVYTVAHNRK